MRLLEENAELRALLTCAEEAMAFAIASFDKANPQDPTMRGAWMVLLAHKVRTRDRTVAEKFPEVDLDELTEQSRQHDAARAQYAEERQQDGKRDKGPKGQAKSRGKLAPVRGGKR